jgi:hypothetical protein
MSIERVGGYDVNIDPNEGLTCDGCEKSPKRKSLFI